MRSRPSGPERGDRRRVGFLGHALAEYVLGAALVAVGIHVTGAVQGFLLGVGSLLVVLNACTDGPLGAVSLVGRRGHHAADLLLVGLLLVSPLTALGQLHVVGVVVAVAVALVLLRMERTTRYAKAPVLAASPEARLPGVAGRAGAIAGAALPGGGGRAGRVARQGARNLGVAVGVTRRVARQRNARRSPPAGERGAAAGGS